MNILIIAEHDNKRLKSSNAHMLTAAKALGEDITLLVIGYGVDKLIPLAKNIAGLKTILVADAEVYEHPLAENLSLLIAEIGKDFDYILAPANTFGKNILPRVAGLMNISMIGDVTQIINANTFVRPIYAGNAFATIESSEKIKLLTIRTTAFQAFLEEENNASIKMINKVIPNEQSQFIKEDLTVSLRPDLSNARIIISGGRGLKSAKNFKLLEKLAEQLGAALGATRAAVDAGFAPNDYQVGQTGKIVAPDLYIAIGISGAIQHLAGMKDSKVIVAINNDPDAPIFQIADYGYVGDLFDAITELMQEFANK